MKFSKYHALGNDYIVLPSQDIGTPLSDGIIKRICHRNFGVGSDGILVGLSNTNPGRFSVRIFNPDGTEAEKSGNGLRIFSRYLWDEGLVGDESFSIHTLGGLVVSQVLEGGKAVSVKMGTVSFRSEQIPVTGPGREVFNEMLSVNGETYRFCAATIGNPHCIIVKGKISAEEAKRIGPVVETDPIFPNRTNVQFLQIMDRSNIRIEIWERGAGYTLASGSSASAAAAVAYRLGLCDSRITVHMPGGDLDIALTENYGVSLTGPVAKVCEGMMAPEMFDPTR